jgi:S1-C subfamily serine protease
MPRAVQQFLACIALTICLAAGTSLHGQPSTNAPARAVPTLSNPTEITTLDGEKYSSVRVLRVKPGGLQIEFKPKGGGIGVSTLPFANLPPALREQYRQAAQMAAAQEKKQSANEVAMRAYEKERLARLPEYAGAQKGDPESQFLLGARYWRGDGLPEDKNAGLTWFRASAEKGFAKAQLKLGSVYQNGDHVKTDSTMALHWYRRAASQGNAEAQYNVGYMFSHGLGVMTNLTEAYVWFQLAAKHGEFRAQAELDTLATEMSSEAIQVCQEAASSFVEKPETGSHFGGLPSLLPGNTEARRSSGTGFFVTDDGYFVTAAHVLKNSDNFHVLTGSETNSATVIKQDFALDLALLKTSVASQGIPIDGKPAGQKLGDAVFTIGFPNPEMQGIAPKLTRGDISSLAGARDDKRFFQISVPVQPGNSGGALVDSNGSVVGVILSRLDDNTTYVVSGALPQNVNYAIKGEILYEFLSSVPELHGRLKAAGKLKDNGGVVGSAERATVLVLAEATPAGSTAW